jgi:hypothetical protein
MIYSYQDCADRTIKALVALTEVLHGFPESLLASARTASFQVLSNSSFIGHLAIESIVK